MSFEVKTHPVPADASAKAWINKEKYQQMYEASVSDPEAFWGEEAKRLDWIKPFTKVKNTNYEYPDVSIKWFEDGTLNVCANCIDRHLEKRGDQVAIIWEGDEPTDDLKVTYKELHEHVCRLANAMKAVGTFRSPCNSGRVPR